MATIKYLGELEVWLPRENTWLKPGDTLEVSEDKVESFIRREDFQLDEKPPKITHLRTKQAEPEVVFSADAELTDNEGE